ncbi:MAG: RdgB/HAM1 family non-canonical purine NTP pyrophosphatase [Synergistaceae bacterium]
MKIILASGNKNKYREMKEEFQPIGVELLFGGDFENPQDVEETGKTYEANSLLKAEAWAKATGLPAMSDDSGLETSALGGAPGVHSTRIIPGSDAERTNWLLEKLKDTDDRNARFVSCITVVFPDGKILSCEKFCPGKIAKKPAGESGFGYDPIFIPKGYDKTFAELGDETKKKISHRALAIKGIAEMLIDVIK